MSTDKNITETVFGRIAGGEAISLHTLKNANNMEVSISQYGGIITAIRVPNRDSELIDVALGYKTLEEYVNDDAFLGAVIGRYANRIAGPEFSIDGEKCTLSATPAGSGLQLHGGVAGFNKKRWHVQPKPGENPALLLSYTSQDGEEGFPGELATELCYTLTENNELIIDYTARTSRPTHVNLTQHSYFNLKGEGSETILDHKISIAADRITPVDEKLLPTGEFLDVTGTPFDLRRTVVIGERINASHQQMQLAGGFDHNYVLQKGRKFDEIVAKVVAPHSGISLEVQTDMPGLQFYTSNFLNVLSGKSGLPYPQRSGLCLETQYFPDSPNQPNFPSTLLRPGQIFRSKTLYRFGYI